jgi:RHS repeat-associated protein
LACGAVRWVRLAVVRLAVVVLAGVAVGFPRCTGADKSGVRPNTVSLPSGPGSIAGLGSAFQPLRNTGTAEYTVSFALPPGTAGHGPTLALSYDSGYGDGPAGIGWRFGPDAIYRRTERGIPRYVDGPNGQDDDHDGEVDEADEEDVLVGLGDEDLVRLDDGTYRARIEGAFLRYRRSGDHWEADCRDGTRLEFGVTAQGRITDTDGIRVCKWLLQRSMDTGGNTITYDYAEFAGSDRQKYLQEIRWGAGAPPWAAFRFVYCTYEARPDWRKDYRSGFLVKTAMRLCQVDIGIQGVQPAQCSPGDWNRDGVPDALIRRYVMAYDDTHPHISLLSRVTQYGADGSTPLPPVSLAYSVFTPPASSSAAGVTLTSVNTPPSLMDSALVDLADLNRDGLPDLLRTDLYGGVHTAYLNLGTGRDGASQWIEWGPGQAMASPDGLAQVLHLDDARVHLADMDGNGLTDLVYTPYSQEVRYFLNRGDGSWGESQRMSIRDTAPPAPFAFSDVETADLDCDKRMDVVRSADTGYTVWFNLAPGTYSQEVRTPGAAHEGRVIRFSAEAVHLADLNGDGLLDVAQIRASQVITCAGMGHGLFAAAVEIPIPGVVLTDGAGSQVQKARLEDVNGDGLADLVIERAQANELWYWLNLGTDAFSSRCVVTDMPSLSASTLVTRWADINGNGTTDLLYADSSGVSRLVAVDIGLLAGGSAHTNLLTGIDNGLGVRTEIAYQSSTDYSVAARRAGEPWSETVPFPVSVIARVTTRTGMDVDLEAGEDTLRRDYSYRDGFYEDRLKTFRGFAAVTVREHGDASAPTAVITQRFHTGGPDGADNDGDTQVDEISDQAYREEDALKGLTRSVAVAAEDGLLISEVTHDWRVRTLAVGTTGTEVRFACDEASEERRVEGSAAPAVLRTTFAYDEFGNVTEQRQYGALSVSGDEVFTATAFINDTDRWILGVPWHQTTSDAAGQKFSESFSYYDGPDYTGLPAAQVTRGRLTRQEGWVADQVSVNRVRQAYDAFGNVTGTMDGNGSRRTIAYDSALQVFPIAETIEVGNGKPDLAIQAEVNLGLGVMTRSTDFNGHETLYEADGFGRLTAIIRPGDSAALPTQAFTYTMAAPDKGLVYAYDRAGNLTLRSGAATASSVAISAREVSGQPGTFDTVQYVDGLGRALARTEEGETGFVVAGAVLFNARGGVRFAVLPYAADTSEYRAPRDPGAARTETRYDAAGRGVLTTHPPDQDGVVTRASTLYAPLASAVTDENGVPKTLVTDGLDRLIEVREPNQGETSVTRYTYDPTGALIRIVDAQANTATFEVDGLGRRTASNDPDRGRMEYTYDAADNLVRTVDNKGQVVEYTYDRAARLLSEDYRDTAGITPDVAFLYDEPAPEMPAAANTKGRLARVQDLSGARFLSYDALGRCTQAVRRIETGGRVADYRTTSGYDAMGRVVSVTHPDGARVDYRYNRRALLDSIPGVVDSLAYQASGQLAAIHYANGVVTTHEVDPRQRLTRLRTLSPRQNGESIQDLRYALDGVGNIRGIADGRGLPAESPANATQQFQYDDLYRLVRATAPGYGAIDFQYDRIGNMVSQASPAAPDPRHIDDPLVNLGTMTCGGSGGTSGRACRLPGDPPGPHAIAATQSGLTYAYDDNGNVTGHAQGDVCTWDFRDRLLRVQTATADVRCTYDDSGQRVVKQVTAGGTETTTLYVSDEFEVRGDRIVKAVFAGSRRLAQIETAAGDLGALRQVLSFQVGWNYFALTLEPADPAIGSVLAEITGSYTDVVTYDSDTAQYIGYVPAAGVADLTELHAHRGYAIRVTSAVSLTVSGTAVAADIALPEGWSLVPFPVAAETAVGEVLAPLAEHCAAVWEYDTGTAGWRPYIAPPHGFLGGLETVAPGRAYWVLMTGPGRLTGWAQPQTIRFFHPDHLGSSNAVTDARGAVVESTEFYPYGRPRYEARTGFDSAYKFTGKELDRESGLMYFEARYYDPVSGRFASTDPAVPSAAGLGGGGSQALGAYAYARGNPLAYVDPTGCRYGYYAGAAAQAVLGGYARPGAGYAPVHGPAAPAPGPARPAEYQPVAAAVPAAAAPAPAPAAAAVAPARYQALLGLQPRYAREQQEGVEGYGPGTTYLTAEQRAQFEVEVRGGLLYLGGRLLDTSGGSFMMYEGDAGSAEARGAGALVSRYDPGRAIFVMDPTGRIYVSTIQIVGQFHHSSFMAGGQVAAAGQIAVEQGRITGISRHSGHYQPGEQHLRQFLTELERRGVANPAAIPQLGGGV